MSHPAAEIVVVIYNRRNSAFSSESCLARAAAIYHGESPGGAENRWLIAREKHGKPYFPVARNVQVSVSHSGDYWAAAFSEYAIGIDLQVHEKRGVEAISKRFFHPDEDAFLRQNDYRDFFTVWTAKESFIKWTGNGLYEDLRSFCVADENGMRSHVGNATLRFLPFHEGYTFCICGEQLGTVRFETGR